MNEITQIMEEVLGEIVPTQQELKQIEKIVNLLKNLLVKRAKELKIEFTSIEPQGSTGIKQTQLRDDFDIDLFIGLDFENYNDDFSSLSKTKFKEKIKKDFLHLCNNWIIKSLTPREFRNPRLLYAEHPYVTAHYEKDDLNIELDIVLYFELDLNFIRENGPITAVDRTPWHGRFIKNELSEEQKNQVRLLKQFFKACHSYGDKSAVGRVGFIGYSAELLIYYLNDIYNVLQKFDQLDKLALDFFDREKKYLKKITHFQNDYLLIIDPIDKNRNVASAISGKAYKYCQYKINQFLNNPLKSFFEIKEIPLFNPQKNQEINKKLFVIECESTGEEVHYTEKRDKLYSLGENIKSHGEKELTRELRFGNIQYEAYFESEKGEFNLALFCSNPILSPTYIRQGPPLRAKKHVKRFKEKNPSYFIKDNYCWVEEKREFSNFLKFIEDFVSDKIPKSLKVINISNSTEAQKSSAKKTLYVLQNWIMPFFE
ncbi:MAG: hypothetical protein EU521_00160 [Promethearchaeota archaeon]|nr:MAG: hypothetical protein EU521_00160 [Candidatus Lokiarchaeota archaeon]